MLNGWKAIAAYVQRDERTAMRWAAERGLPVHRTPGAGRGSVYALAEEVDAWLANDRERALDAGRAVPTELVPATPPVVRLSPVLWWRRRWVAGALTVSGVLLMAVGALTLHHPARGDPTPEPVFTDSIAKAMFLQARFDWNLRTRDSLMRATQEYSNAIGRDPRVPAAYVGLANSYLLLREYGSMPETDAYARAEAAARAAIALAPQSSEAHRALAFIDFWWRQDRATAGREFARAIGLKPDDPLTHHWFANALLANGEVKAALREITVARDLDPTSSALLSDQSMVLYIAGHRAEGLAGLRVLTREQPDAIGPHRSLAEIALFEGRSDEFLQQFALVARLRGDTAGLAEAARWQAAGPDKAGVETAMLRDARGAAGQAHTDWFRVAQTAAVAGQSDEAKNALSRACDAHEPATVSAPIDLWLSHALTPADIAERCGRASPMS